MNPILPPAEDRHLEQSLTPPATSSGWFGRITQQTGSFISRISGRVVAEAAGWICISSTAENYLEELREKIQLSQDRDAVKKISIQMRSQIAENATDFQRGILEGSTILNFDLFELLLTHALVSLKSDKENPNLIQGATESLLESIILFSQKPHITLKASFETYSKTENPEEKQAALQVIEQEITPLVEEIMQKAGLDKNGLSHILAMQTEMIEAMVKQWLIKVCAKRYIEISKGENSYLTELHAKIADPEANKQIAEIAQKIKIQGQALAVNNFQKSLLQTTDVLEFDPIQLIITHALAAIKQPDCDPITSARKSVLTSVTAFAKQPNPLLKTSYQAYKNSTSEEEKKRALAAMQTALNPLVNELMEKAGLDKAGIAIILEKAGLSILLDQAVSAIDTLIKPLLIEECAEQYIKLTTTESAYLKKLQDTIDNPDVKTLVSHLAQAIKQKALAQATSDLEKGLLETTSVLDTDPFELVLTHALVSLKGDAPDTDLLKVATESIVTSFVTFIQQPHPARHASYQAYCSNKDPAHLKAIQQEFIPLAREIMQKAGLDKKGLTLLFPYMTQPLEEAITQEIIEKCTNWYLDIQQARSFTIEEEDSISSMGGRESIEVLGNTLATKATKALFSGCNSSSTIIAAKINNSLGNTLSKKEQFVLAGSISSITASDSTCTKQLSSIIQPAFATLLTQGFFRIALKSPKQQGTVVNRIEGYVRDMCKDVTRDVALEKQIREYNKQNQQLSEAKIALHALECQTHEQHSQEDVERIQERIQEQIQEQELIVRQLTNAITPKKRALLALFTPAARKIINDMGYNSPSDLPLPASIQEEAFTNLVDTLLSEFMLDSYANIIDTIQQITRESSERYEHMENLKKRFGNYNLTNAVNPYAKILVKAVQSTLALDAQAITTKGIESAQQSLSEKNDEDKALIALIFKNKDYIQEWIAQNSAAGIESIGHSFGKEIESETEAFLIRILDNFTATIEKLEEEDPKRTFLFVHDLMTGMTKHLRLINQVTQQHKKKHMYEINPLELVKEFEKQNALDPAMPSYKMQLNIKNLKDKIKRLEKQISQNAGDIKNVKLQLEEARLSLNALEVHAEQTANKHFYQPTLSYFLAMCKINSPKDLPGPTKVQETLWEFLHNEQGATLFAEIFTKAFEPEKLDKYLRIAMESVNENLQTPEEKNKTVACSEEDRIMAEAAIDLLREVRTSLPGTILGKLHQIDEIQKLPAHIVAEVMRKTFKNYSMNALLEDSLLKGSLAATELLAVEKAFPKNAADLKEALEQKKEAHARDIKEYHREAGETVYSGAEKIRKLVVDKWGLFQTKLNSQIADLFGKIGVATKRVLDPIMHVIFIDCCIRPLFSIFNLSMRLFYITYSNQIVHHAEHLRRCITKTPIHANYAMTALRLFQRNFRMEEESDPYP